MKIPTLGNLVSPKIVLTLVKSRLKEAIKNIPQKDPLDTSFIDNGFSRFLICCYPEKENIFFIVFSDVAPDARKKYFFEDGKQLINLFKIQAKDEVTNGDVIDLIQIESNGGEYSAIVFYTTSTGEKKFKQKAI